MADNEPLSVQAIKGKFEQMQDFSFGNVSSSTSSKSPSCRRRRNNFPSSDTLAYQKDSPLLAQEEVPEEMSKEKFKSFAEKDSRLRSLSVGNWSPSTGFQRRRSEKPSGEKLSRNHSFSRSLKKEVEVEKNSQTQFPNNNFSSFSEKQRLVESIVMNIKNSAGTAKRKEQQSKEPNKSKEIFNITSKFEKDLKNALERGVRKKWISKSSKEEKHLKEGQEKVSIMAKREPFSNKDIGISQRKSFSKINSIFGVDLYPIRPSSGNDIQSKESGQTESNNYPIYKSENSPIMFDKSNDRMKTNHKIETYDNVPYRSSGEKSPSSLVEKRNLSSSSPVPKEGEENPVVTSSSNLSPVRPPRRRRVKKGKAPLPPSHDWDSKDNKNITQSNINRDTQEEEQSELVFGEVDDRDLKEESYNNDSAFYSMSGESTRRLSCELSKDFDYEDRCERKLEGESFLYDKESIENTFNDSYKTSHSKDNDTMSPSKWMSVSDSSLGVRTSPLPVGGPPKKPPRTFAYDIYRSLQIERFEKPQFCSTPKLTLEEVESLYTKPLKRLKEKPTSPLPSTQRRNTDASINKPNKPTIAPKPLDIINKAKKRLSVVEPLPSVVESKEYSDQTKPSMKRNSSFRFSFRKQKKNSSPQRQTSTRKENHMGRRFKAVTRNLHPKKHDAEKRVRFQSKLNTENIYNDIDGGPIYATPDNQNDYHPKEQSEELHYMCSQLFPKEGGPPGKEDEPLEGDLKECQKENLPPPPEDDCRERLGIMDGLKEELRQSCRLVQKRWKAGSPPKHGR